MCRFKVEILIDEEKVIKDDKYEPQDMYDCIRKMFKRFDLSEIKTDKPYHFIFTDKGRKQDYGALWRVILDLYDKNWFKRYTLKYTWYNIRNYTCEDIMSEFDNFEVKGI